MCGKGIGGGEFFFRRYALCVCIKSKQIISHKIYIARTDFIITIRIYYCWLVLVRWVDGMLVWYIGFAAYFFSPIFYLEEEARSTHISLFLQLYTTIRTHTAIFHLIYILYIGFVYMAICPLLLLLLFAHSTLFVFSLYLVHTNVRNNTYNIHTAIHTSIL